MKMDATQRDNYLEHYGIKRRSGRYPWGSGANPHQRSMSFLQVVDDLKKQGMSESAIAKSFSKPPEFPFSVADLRATRSIAVNEVKANQIRQAQKLRDKGMGASEIARQMSTPDKQISESTVRSLLEPGRQDKIDVLQTTADMLKRQVAEKGFVDIGAKVEMDLPMFEGKPPVSISADKFNTAVSILKDEGYNVHPVHITQVGTGERTRYKVLVAPGVTKQEAYANRDNIRLISEKTDDRGHTYTDFGIQTPLSIHPDRVGIKYKEDGGADADGVIYVRPGVKDVNLGKSTYAQVRIQVGDGHYLKGMAVYKDDLPKGVDLMFNTNKSNTGNKLDALKELKRNKDTGEVDKDNPFGAVIKEGGQILGKNGKVESAMNIVNEEGDWDKWSKNISSQVLSKQKPDLAEAQLGKTYADRRAEYEKIKALTNPQVKKKLLESFADETDSASVHLKAAAMPGQAQKVLLPSTHVKPTEIFAPTFENGTRVALIRYPHAGTFEIPELTVNNRSPEARKLLQVGKGGKAPDAVVIHPKVAQHLSGADFDGDSVVVIPNNRKSIEAAKPLKQLENFDPQAAYKPYHGMKTIDGGVWNEKTRKVDYGVDANGKPRSPKTSPKQQEMGNVTNLISDMTVRGASHDEIARAVRHSMVVIDSEKHSLDYKASERDNGIVDLKRRYQGVHPKGQLKGASTLITRATSETRIDKTKPASTGPDHPGRARVGKHVVDVSTGRKLTVPSGEHSVQFTVPGKNKGDKPRKITKTFGSKEEAEKFIKEQQPHGELKTKQVSVDKLAITSDAHSLVSDANTRIERIYADHSNRLKAMANEARKEHVSTTTIPYSKSANKVYKHEVQSLEAKLRRAEKNAPLERQAQVVANRIVAQRKQANPDMDKDELRKIKGQALNEARIRTGAKKTRIGTGDSQITNKEWEAIQAGAISNHKLERILRNADLDVIRERATPRPRTVMTDARMGQAKSMLARGFTYAEVADRLGVAQSTLKSSLEEVK
jgi:hypothetical protein